MVKESGKKSLVYEIRRWHGAFIAYIMRREGLEHPITTEKLEVIRERGGGGRGNSLAAWVSVECAKFVISTTGVPVIVNAMKQGTIVTST